MHPCLLAQAVSPSGSWLPVLLLIVIGIGFSVSTVIMSILVGPSRTGPGKESTYESGMVPVGDTSKRFNAKFYLLAMSFLVIDVEIVFLYPWATVFGHTAAQGGDDAFAMLGRVFFFIALLGLSYVYAWGKGIFRFD